MTKTRHTGTAFVLFSLALAGCLGGSGGGGDDDEGAAAPFSIRGDGDGDGDGDDAGGVPDGGGAGIGGEGAGGEGGDGAAADGASNGSEGGDTDQEAPEPYALPVEGFVSNTVQWASMLVRTTKLEWVGGLEGQYLENGRYATLAWFDPHQQYLRVTAEFTNLGDDEKTFLERRGTWDVLLPDGPRIAPVTPIGISVLPGNTATGELLYAVDEALDLGGAWVQLEGEERGIRAPEELPLTASLERRFPRIPDGIVGTVLSTEKWRVELDAIYWDRNLDTLWRARRGEHTLWMQLAVTRLGSSAGSWDSRDARLSIAGRSIAPAEDEDASIDGGTTEVLLAGFRLPEDATVVELSIPSGYDYFEPIVIDLEASTLAPLPTL